MRLPRPDATLSDSRKKRPVIRKSKKYKVATFFPIASFLGQPTERAAFLAPPHSPPAHWHVFPDERLFCEEEPRHGRARHGMRAASELPALPMI